ncbi:MAG: MaoC family dehydratase N-terminal domain-containing protein [Myxococcota bacterium]|nr:MaoC family dehydratase N-terminal domain-containing protein [Myxococcota bacterium]
MKLDFESAEAGTPLESISIPALNRVGLARYAGAVDDFGAVHLDDKVAKAAGKASVFAPGTLVMAYLGRVVQASLEGASLRRFGLRITRLLWPGDVLTCRGVVVETRKEDGEYCVDMDVWADNQRGETVAKGRVLAVVPKDGKSVLTKASAGRGIIYELPEAKFLKEDEPVAPVKKRARKKSA